MKINLHTSKRQRSGIAGVSMVESLIGMSLAGLTLAGLLTGITRVASILAISRDQAKATEIVSETLDSLRLYSWNQITNPAFLPGVFQVLIDDNGASHIVYPTGQSLPPAGGDSKKTDEEEDEESSGSSENDDLKNIPPQNGSPVLKTGNTAGQTDLYGGPDYSGPIYEGGGNPSSGTGKSTGRPRSGQTDPLPPAGSVEQVYSGTIQLGAPPTMTEAYQESVKQITVAVEWVSHGRTNRTELSTFITQYGLQGQIVN